LENLINRSRYYVRLAILALCVPLMSTADVGSDILTACKTLGGSYEQSIKGCDPECLTTFTCIFEDGAGRICDMKGRCTAISAANSSAGTGSESQAIGSEPAHQDSSAFSKSSSCEQCQETRTLYCKQVCPTWPVGKKQRCRKDCLKKHCGEWCPDL
jgi:hypothetical protein